jgi:hypothetical protein
MPAVRLYLLGTKKAEVGQKKETRATEESELSRNDAVRYRREAPGMSCFMRWLL